MWIHMKKGQRILLPSGARMVFSGGCRHWCPEKFVGLLEEGSYWEDDGEGNPLVPEEVVEEEGEGEGEKEEPEAELESLGDPLGSF